MGTCRSPRFEFHVLRNARDQYGLDDALFSLTGNVVFINFHAVRVLAHAMNAKRDLVRFPHLTVKAGALNAMGLIDEIYHYILQLYEQTINPGVFRRALESLEQSIGGEELDRLLAEFTDIFPPTSVYRGTESPGSYLSAGTVGKPNTQIVLEELIHVYFANYNPAFRPFRELFDDEGLKTATAYAAVLSRLDTFFQQEKKIGPGAEDVFTFLRAPILASPDNLEGQLAFIRKNWGTLLSDLFLRRMASAGDLLKEDLRFIFPGGGPVQTHVPRYGGDESSEYLRIDEERFTPDTDWMPNVVLLAKNTYVWLDQLSKKYHRSIRTLDQIPDEELDRLARWNFTGLWLIGIWERSRSSQRIKQMTGNPEAVASAYSLYDYDIAADLGGEEAFQQLRHRAWQRGVRLAGDMVPNHVGLYSRWVVEHPEYFIQSSYSPFPNYRFTGENLSDHPSVEVRVEDGYWSRSDAAVVFQRYDRSNGNVTYIYHGNDGTNMPWNDTAQLDFLKNEVREAVIGSIFHVARKFSIIRFDAAMVLAKKHFQRLWYPEPGSGGAIPSRSDHAMSKRDFDAAFPREFWREVVDRINAEMPNTLLLAEAFWLLEGYFVRTLGMHRVYNSAFMHMLMNEENAKYRELIRNTLHYNPEILKRYVNFMSNPDEKTAVEQFGKGDKYAGIAIMMVTLPGLPMFAHGQIEGYAEKYGMEYRRAYYEEYPDDELIRRHEKIIFPLMSKRHLFSQVHHFEMYDFVTPQGRIDENVFAYSNQYYGERAFVCYNNRYGETEGFVKMTSGKVEKETGGPISWTTLAQKFGFRGDHNLFYVFKDHVSGLEYLRPGSAVTEQGFFIRLHAYEFHVFLQIQELWDGDGTYRRVFEQNGNNGIPDVWYAAKRLRLEGVHEQFIELFREPDVVSSEGTDTRHSTIPEKFLANLESFIRQSNQIANLHFSSDQIRMKFAQFLDCLGEAGLTLYPVNQPSKKSSIGSMQDLLADPRERSLLVLLLFLRTLTADEIHECSDKFLLDDATRALFYRKGYSDADAGHEILFLHLLVDRPRLAAAASEHGMFRYMVGMLSDSRLLNSVGLHEHEGIRYYHKESFERAMRWLSLCLWLDGAPYTTAVLARKGAAAVQSMAKKISLLSEKAHFQYDQLMDSINVMQQPDKNRISTK